jgi:uncharacterized coiled-coil DUF342 family protein
MASEISPYSKKYIEIPLEDGTVYRLPDITVDLTPFTYAFNDTGEFIEKTIARDALMKHWSEVLIPEYGVFLVNLISESKSWNNQVKKALEALLDNAKTVEKNLKEIVKEGLIYLDQTNDSKEKISTLKKDISLLSGDIYDYHQEILKERKASSKLKEECEELKNEMLRERKYFAEEIKAHSIFMKKQKNDIQTLKNQVIAISASELSRSDPESLRLIHLAKRLEFENHVGFEL